ncbi:uncharacterized protein LOC116956613 isoform X2 [Petromyzon marinus]|uniref:uncharacterized protein LOC116956613 isoform X2 n=1 Tax=Petromyzon marinus TaxID=7757 RepID=UPI003F730FA8
MSAKRKLDNPANDDHNNDHNNNDHNDIIPALDDDNDIDDDPAAPPPPPPPPSKRRRRRPRHTISMRTKVAIIRWWEGGGTAAGIGRALGLNRSTIYTIMRDRARIVEHVRASAPVESTIITKRRSGAGGVEEMEKRLVAWLEEQRFGGGGVDGGGDGGGDGGAVVVPLSFRAIQRKARSLFEELTAARLVHDDMDVHDVVDRDGGGRDGRVPPPFVASRGWFDRFKARANLQSVRLSCDGRCCGDDGGGDDGGGVVVGVEGGSGEFPDLLAHVGSMRGGGGVGGRGGGGRGGGGGGRGGGRCCSQRLTLYAIGKPPATARLEMDSGIGLPFIKQEYDGNPFAVMSSDLTVKREHSDVGAVATQEDEGSLGTGILRIVVKTEVEEDAADLQILKVEGCSASAWEKGDSLEGRPDTSHENFIKVELPNEDVGEEGAVQKNSAKFRGVASRPLAKRGRRRVGDPKGPRRCSHSATGRSAAATGRLAPTYTDTTTATAAAPAAAAAPPRSSRRRANFTSDELEALVRCVGAHLSDIDLVPNGQSTRHARKERAWLDVASGVSAVGLCRSVAEVKKKWFDLRSQTKRKAAALRREAAGAGGLLLAALQLSPIEEKVAAMLETTEAIRCLAPRMLEHPRLTKAVTTKVAPPSHATSTAASDQDSRLAAAPLTSAQPLRPSSTTLLDPLGPDEDHVPANDDGPPAWTACPGRPPPGGPDGVADVPPSSPERHGAPLSKGLAAPSKRACRGRPLRGGRGGRGVGGGERWDPNDGGGNARLVRLMEEQTALLRAAADKLSRGLRTIEEDLKGLRSLAESQAALWKNWLEVGQSGRP